MRYQGFYRAATPVIFGIATILSLGASRPAQARIQVEVNGQPVHFAGAQPTQIGGRVFIPLRHVAESLDAEVSWDEATRTVHGSRAGNSFALPLGSRRAYINGRAVTLDAPARMVGGRTIVPLRFAAEALGAEVAWHASEQLVSVNLPNGEHVAGTREQNRVVPAQTVVRAELVDALSSATARKGDTFTATLNPDDHSGFPLGTRFEGRVTQVQTAAKDRPGIIDVAFDRAILPDGTQVAIVGTLASLDKTSVERAADGRLIAKQDAQAKKEFDWKWVGVGAAGGAVLGGVLGDKWVKGGVIGALGGAVYAYLQKNKKSQKYSEVSLDEGTDFGILLKERVAFRQ